VLILTLDPERHTQATEAAAHGYVGVVMSARPLPSAPAGKGAPKAPPPYEHEGEDARAVIGWITAQGFSNGQVAMMGHGYSGYVAWAAARGAPRGLVAIVAAGATAPGIDAPMEGNIFRNDAYRWALYFAGTTHDDGDAPHGRELDARWFESGRPYRDLDKVAGAPSAVFQRWLRHPTFDAYWQDRLPSMHDLATLAIPVLTLTGYYDVGESGALYYFTEQRRARPNADHILLAGPYDEEALRGAAPESLGGYRLDAAARVDLAELRYQWLDHVLRRAVRPGLLAAPINYEVMGANAWRHVAQLPTGVSLKLYLDQAQGGAALVRHKPAAKVSAGLTVDFRERRPPSLELDPPLLSRSLLWRDALRFVSDPLPDSVELTGHLVLNLLQSVNQRDVDLTVSLYEQLPGGEHLLLYTPPYEQRASFAQDRSNRSLLTPGRVQKLVLTSSRLLARRTEPGSRLELLLGVKRRADEQLNYGTGGDVSRESRADAHRPLTIRWYGGSYLEIPVGP
jgi:putative CocE/NonD family hydrolase